MKAQIHGLLFTVLVVALPAAGAAPDKEYVTEKVEVLLRRGPSVQHKIVKGLPLGAAVTVLQRDEQSGYSRVKLEDGEQGWILTRNLTSKPVPQSQLEEAILKMESALDENRRLKEELAAAVAAKDTAEQTAQTLKSAAEKLNTELLTIRHASSNALQIQAERDQLQGHVINLERELEVTRREKQALDGDQRQDWFLIGAGVLFGGIMLGFLLPRLGWRRKSGWDSL